MKVTDDANNENTKDFSSNNSSVFEQIRLNTENIEDLAVNWK